MRAIEIIQLGPKKNEKEINHVQAAESKE